jgi:hypothetical protein
VTSRTELKKLRPHVGNRLASTIALSRYDPREHPRDLARDYHKQQQAPPPTSKSAKK